MRQRHTAGGAALGLSCAACCEPLAGIFASGAASLQKQAETHFGLADPHYFLKNSSIIRKND